MAEHWTRVLDYPLMDELGSPFASWQAPYAVYAKLDQDDNIKAVKSVIVHAETGAAREIEIRFNKRETKIILHPYLAAGSDLHSSGQRAASEQKPLPTPITNSGKTDL